MHTDTSVHTYTSMHTDTHRHSSIILERRRESKKCVLRILQRGKR